MGHSIVYCQICGTRLRQEDFDRGKAHVVGHRVFCAKCMPLPAAPKPAGRAGSTARLPSVSAPLPGRRGSSVRLPAVAATPRRGTNAVSDASATKILIAAVATLALAVVLLLASRPSSKPEAPAPARPGVVQDKALLALQDLEKAVLENVDAEALLARCAAARPLLAGTRYENRLREIENRARETLMQREFQNVDRLGNLLKDIREIIRWDDDFNRRNDVLNMLGAAERIAGDRKPEVDRLRAEYEAKLRAKPR